MATRQPASDGAGAFKGGPVGRRVAPPVGGASRHPHHWRCWYRVLATAAWRAFPPLAAAWYHRRVAARQR